eukprot:413032-Amphidinium_carterae.1
MAGSSGLLAHAMLLHPKGVGPEPYSYGRVMQSSLEVSTGTSVLCWASWSPPAPPASARTLRAEGRLICGSAGTSAPPPAFDLVPWIWLSPAL